MDAELAREIEGAQSLLPLWFVPRMMTDEWVYGLMMASGNIVAVERMQAVRRAADGSLWIDVILAPADDYWGGNHYDPSVFGAPSSRRRASINVAHVAAAFELVDRRDPPAQDHSA